MSRPRTPEDVHSMWVQAINAGDIEAVLALYEPESAIVNPNGELVSGLDGVRDVNERTVATATTVRAASGSDAPMRRRGAAPLAVDHDGHPSRRPALLGRNDH
jgi:ketosteroid isomerase-like protein